jgi:hypothetical protein
MSNGKSPKKLKSINSYQDPTDLSPKNLEIGLWIATNRKLIYKTLIIILASIAAGFLLYSGYGYFYYFVFGQEQDRTLESSMDGVDLAAYRAQNTPIDISYNQARVIANNGGSDFIVHLKNLNDKQSATFSYCFKAAESEACGSNFILPSEEKDVVLINSNIKSVSGIANFEIKSINWQKLKAGEIPDWNTFKSQRLNFIISQPKFSTYGTNVNYLEFDVTNNSSYSYFEVPINIIINRNGEIMAINRYVLEGLNSRETKSIRLSWPEAVNLSGAITATPELNLLDNSIYKPYSSN